MARTLMLVGLAALLVPVAATAAVITVDGDMSDWGTGAGWGTWNDANEGDTVDNYDIKSIHWHFGNKPAEAGPVTTLFLGVEFFDAFEASGTGSRSIADAFFFNFDTIPGQGGSPSGMGGWWPASDFYVRWAIPDAPLNGPGVSTDLVLFRWKTATNNWGWASGGAKEVGDNGVWAGWSNDTVNDAWYTEFAIPITSLWGAGPVDDFGWSVYYDNGLPSADDFAPGQERFVPVDVPEPGTMALFGLGMLGLFVARRRRAA